jgi:hypothetical protein
MPAMTPTPRPSLTTDLASRYVSQHVGGAYDAKKVKTQPIDFGILDSTYEAPNNFGSDNFNEKALNFSDSLGVDKRKYKG